MRRLGFPLTQPGWVMLVATSVLVAFGLASIFVTDTHYRSGHDGAANAMRQCVRIGISLALCVVILRVGYYRISRYAFVVFLSVVALLLPLLIAKLLKTSFGGLTAPRNGAYRWIHLPGFPLQPSEFLKLASVIALASYLQYRRSYRRFGGLLVPLVVSTLPLGLVLLQPDLGTALLLIPVMLVMLFAAGARVKHLSVIVLIGVLALPIAWRQIKGYQRARVTAVLLQSDWLRQAVIERPENFTFFAGRRQAVEWAASSGYQLVHSKNAVGSGGLFGNGWGEGVYAKSALLPDRHNDFIFSVIAHQWGFFGAMVVLACYVAIMLAGIRIASGTTDPFGRLLSIGIVALIAVQVVINVGMTVGLMPITGLTLPFVSYGGSSLVTQFVGLALLVSVSQHRPFLLATRPFEFSRGGRVSSSISMLGL